MRGMDSATVTLVFCDGHLLVPEGSLQPAAPGPEMREVLKTHPIQDSFELRPQGFAVIGLSGAADVVPPGFEWVRIRQLLAGESPQAAAACRGLGLLNWRMNHRFCGVCGGKLNEHPDEVARQCPACGHVEYPGISPAVIVRVEKEGKILLARHVQRSRDFFTCIAGYLEVGESAEDAVRREVREEVGLEISGVRYAGSQHWPYPNQLMLAFAAQWAAGELRLQPEEISDAQWFDPAHLPNIPPPGSVAYRLIHGLR